jgi:hypothetical protein
MLEGQRQVFRQPDARSQGGDDLVGAVEQRHLLAVGGHLHHSGALRIAAVLLDELPVDLAEAADNLPELAESPRLLLRRPEHRVVVDAVAAGEDRDQQRQHAAQHARAAHPRPLLGRDLRFQDGDALRQRNVAHAFSPSCRRDRSETLARAKTPAVARALWIGPGRLAMLRGVVTRESGAWPAGSRDASRS